MPRRKVVIVGAGFAGLSCLKHLTPKNACFDITLIDRKTTSDFLPLLPDIIGRNFPPHMLTHDIAAIAKRCRAEFVNTEAQSIDVNAKRVVTPQGEIVFDDLVIACGAETNFYGNTDIQRQAMTLFSIQDALKIKETLATQTYRHVVVAGGGYTGIEIAGSIRRWLKRHHRQTEVMIVEKMDSILGPLPEWIKNYTRRQLEEMKINVLLGRTISKTEGGSVTLSDGSRHDESLLIWVAGVKTPDLLNDIPVEKIRGRLSVDPCLRVTDHIFAAGDCAAFIEGSQPLRMAVMFAMGQGKCIARNIIRTEKNRKAEKYVPLDLGYIIPVANNRSSGILLGKGASGFWVTWLHYLISFYRSFQI